MTAYIKGTVPGPEAAVLRTFDLDYALGVARTVASFGSYGLGFRPAGSAAVSRCAEYLHAELCRVGLPQVTVDSFPVDGWDFQGARIEVEEGPVLEAVAYGGASGTRPGGLTGDLVDCRGGTAADYRDVDVRGKIALIEIDFDQVNWPGVALLEAQHQGAAAVVCWPGNQFATGPDAFHTHDLQAESPVPMLNVSASDGRQLRSFKRALLHSTARPLPGATGRNIVGILPGTDLADQVVIIGDHYDAWFTGFMDDAIGVGAVLGLARAIMQSGYRPRRTLAFVLHDAEEFGRRDSPWDWCAGAHEQITRLRPEWAGRAVGAVIFELCGFKAAQSLDWYVSRDLAPFAEQVLVRLDTAERYPQGAHLHPKVTTWVDAFSYTAAGVPSAANLELTEHVRSHYYHTQFDTEDLLDRDKYALHIAGLGLLALRLDQAELPPVDLAQHARTLRSTLPLGAPPRLFQELSRLEGAAEEFMSRRRLPQSGRLLLEAAAILNRGLTWVGGDGMDETLYPHQQPLKDLSAMMSGHLGVVAGMSWGRNVSYPVYRDYLFGHEKRPERCGLWAAGRVSPYVDVWEAYQAGQPAPQDRVEQAQLALQKAYEHETRVLQAALKILSQV